MFSASVYKNLLFAENGSKHRSKSEKKDLKGIFSL